MKKTIVRVLCLALVAVMMVACLASCGKKNYAENNTKIKIGVSGPLTGGAAIYGIAVRNAAKLAIDEINAIEAATPVLGLQFELDMYDDKHDATNIPTGYANLYEGGMQVSLGTVTTKPGLEYKVLSSEDNVFFLTPSATGDAIPEFSNGYQMCFADSNQGSASAKYFNENYTGKKIGVFYKADDEYSKGIYDKFMETIDASFGTVVSASFTGEANTFDSQIQLLKDCDVIFMPIYYTPASQFMTQGKDTVKASAIYYGCDGLDGIDAIEGFKISEIPQEVSYLSHFNSNATEGPAKVFIDKYNATYDEAKEPLNQFGAAAYDGVWAINEAMKVA
ncbi:MAG: ABC transporter substrate-binding protein, partial [Clostridia bacterium]|nr:ABC transporter substrate-binding protein [Clostridia bacterium]